jgi:formamidopyrimidine-DNA glycosylase
MPELPEIEHLRRTLDPWLLGARVREANLIRRDVLRARPDGCDLNQALLAGARVVDLRRRGKQVAIVASDGRALCIHLGMSGRLWIEPHRQPRPLPDHVHCRWRIDGPRGRGELIFRDPRRFGGLWAFASMQDLERQRWSALGPDALAIAAAQLRARLADSSRSIKAALLDQAAVAGVGNIYADESLFASRIHPLRSCRRLEAEDWSALAAALRLVLRRAISAGGSTLRDYRDADGSPGLFTIAHRVYGRAGLPCPRCRSVLRSLVVAGRTTVACPGCQPGGRPLLGGKRRDRTRRRRKVAAVCG